MTGTAEIQFDQEGDAYFMTEEGVVHYINEFCRDMFINDGVAYKPLSNMSSMGITVEGEQIFYEIFQA
jgi:hypothetical protein